MARLSAGILSCCWVLLLLAGCRAAVGPGGEPQTQAPRLTAAEPLWRYLAVRRDRFRDLKGMARVRVTTTDRSVALDQVVVVLRGFEAMRLEGLGPVGQPLFLLIVRDRRFWLYTPQENQLISGAATARNFSRVFEVSIAPATLQYVLGGDVPLSRLPKTGSMTYLSGRHLYLWQGQPGGQVQDYRIWFDPRSWQPVRLEITQPFGDVALAVHYADFQVLDDVRLPYRITIEQPFANRYVDWKYTDVQLNTGVSRALFQMRVPEGTEWVEVE
jgi:outer membrane lipoprotein-sorting protein